MVQEILDEVNQVAFCMLECRTVALGRKSSPVSMVNWDIFHRWGLTCTAPSYRLVDADCLHICFRDSI